MPAQRDHLAAMLNPAMGNLCTISDKPNDENMVQIYVIEDEDAEDGAHPDRPSTEASYRVPRIAFRFLIPFLIKL